MKNLILILLLPLIVGAESPVDCAFDTSPGYNNQPGCNWSELTKNIWFKANQTSIIKVTPGHDHTCLTHPNSSIQTSTPQPCGTWLSTLPPENYTGTQDFKLISPILEPHPNSSKCFTFWYHFFGVLKSQLKVAIDHEKYGFTATQLWANLLPESNNWIEGRVTIPPQSKQYYILLNAELNSKYHDTVGLDDILMIDGTCPQMPNQCDFEIDLCGWSISGDGASRVNESLPWDHTTKNRQGHFILNKGNEIKSQLTASLKDITENAGENFNCLKFWYYFAYDKRSKDTKSYLEVNISTFSYYHKMLNISDAISEEFVNGWQPYYVSIPNVANNSQEHNGSNIIITMFSSVTSSYIAIDDILLENRSCEVVGECDFENDFCGWISSPNNIHWLRSQGGSQNGLKKAPMMDTTMGTAEGWFAMIPIEFIQTFYGSQLQSPPIEYKSYQNCFKMSYFAIGNDTKTTALEVIFGDLTNYGKLIGHIHQLNTSETNIWQQFHLQLPDKMPERYSIRIQIPFNHNLHKLYSDIAIDDLKLTSEC